MSRKFIMRRECRCMQRVPRVREAISGTTKRDSRQLCPLRQIKIQPQLQWEECTISASSVPENISTLRRGIRPIPISSSIPSTDQMIRSGRWRMPERDMSSLYPSQKCRGKKVLLGFNSLADLTPELVKEWSSDNPDLPSEYLRSSRHKALWTCPICHGDYQYRICDRELDDKSCPYCCDKKILPGYNSFKVRHPEEMEEWDG